MREFFFVSSRVKSLTLFLICAFIVAFFAYFFYLRYYSLPLKFEVFGSVTLTSLAVILAVSNLVTFLDADSKSNQFQTEGTIRQRREIDAKLMSIIKETTTVSKIEDNVFEKTKDHLEKFFFSNLELKYKKYIEQDLRTTFISHQVSPIIRDTEIYIRKIQRNSIVNLIIGILSSIAAIIFLAYSILATNDLKLSWDVFLMHFLPRLTFVILIQLFTYFFLRLYRNNLEDAKYFQNELTNLNSKISALKIAHILDNGDKINELLTQLAATERNFKLMKDESLLSIEKAKLEKEVDIDIVSAFKDFLKIYKKD